MTILLTVYALIWPVTVAVILFLISKGFYQDWREARKEGRTLV